MSFDGKGSRIGGATRRTVLAGAAAIIAAPYTWTRANAARVVRIRTSGRNVEDVMKPAVWDRFTKETGIEVVSVPSTVTKMLATIKAGQPDVDVANAGIEILLRAERAGGLVPVDYDKFKFAKLADIPALYRRPMMCGTYQYGTLMAYNTEAFKGAVPASWADFWDAKAFPGKRTLQDMSSGRPNLEFALLADGVPADKLYPLDVERAFASLGRIKAQIAKFWNTSALANQMMIDKEAVLGALWNGPLMTAIAKGAPLAPQWNQHMVSLQSLAVTKGARDAEAAQMLIDFTSTPESQAGMAKGFGYGPINDRAFALLPDDLLGQTIGSIKLRDKGFLQDDDWWTDNTPAVSQRWSKWVLE
ncbi:ABC transporter substrate-binding protein [Chelatococcus sp. GCM10030263]|uniref:ABC transporter substrate-binding protein n=1 Tax=Chelatococcus sp. GCM10030263 TaxID=3273387 RepID=UPI0036061FBD